MSLWRQAKSPFASVRPSVEIKEKFRQCDSSLSAVQLAGHVEFQATISQSA